MSLDIEKIGDVCTVGDGAHASIKRTLNGIPYYTSKNFKIEGIDLSKVDYISEEDFKKHFRSNSNAITKPIKDDILLSIIGSIGAPHLVKDEDDFGLSSSVSILRPNVSKIEPQYLYYWIKSDDFQNSVHQIKSGVAQSFLSLSMIKQLPVVYPKSLETQKRIASILSTYDDLIENNLKRIKVLEETAQNIYKEWFVNFRFPNYEHTEFDSESHLPVGWEMKKVEDCIKVMKGKKPKKEYSTIGENRILYLLVDVLERRELRFTENESVQLTSEGETLMLMDGSRSGLVFKSLEGAIGSTLAVFRIKNAVFGINYCFNFFKFREVEIISKNTGSAIPHANKSYIYGMEMPIPSDKISTEFEIITSKIYKQIEILSSQNQKLKEARDILLPRLMNRTIEV
jgi:type I restriction enzyme S subunit